MKMTKHAYARFKQRQKIKNEGEMMRRFSLALRRGILLPDESSQPGTLCYLFNGYKYIVSADDETLVTVFSAKNPTEQTRHRLIDEIRMRQSIADVRWCLRV